MYQIGTPVPGLANYKRKVLFTSSSQLFRSGLSPRTTSRIFSHSTESLPLMTDVTEGALFPLRLVIHFSCLRVLLLRVRKGCVTMPGSFYWCTARAVQDCYRELSIPAHWACHVTTPCSVIHLMYFKTFHILIDQLLMSLHFWLEFYYIPVGHALVPFFISLASAIDKTRALSTFRKV